VVRSSGVLASAKQGRVEELASPSTRDFFNDNAAITSQGRGAFVDERTLTVTLKRGGEQDG